LISTAPFKTTSDFKQSSINKLSISLNWPALENNSPTKTLPPNSRPRKKDAKCTPLSSGRVTPLSVCERVEGVRGSKPSFGEYVRKEIVNEYGVDLMKEENMMEVRSHVDSVMKEVRRAGKRRYEKKKEEKERGGKDMGLG
jgi:hypothetical protein